MCRVVVTGLGVVSPVGNDVEIFWESLKRGKLGIGKISRFDAGRLKVSLDADSCLVIEAPLVCPDRLVTNDIAELSEGCFRILGRKDNVICSGGIKIQIEQVERQLQPHLKSPFLITKRSDAKFGEVVVLLTEGAVDEARSVCERILPKYHHPRVYLQVAQIPLTETGKPARQQAEQLARQA